MQWNRLTLSRLTTAYAVFSVTYTMAQLALQLQAFKINETAATVIWDLAYQAKDFDVAVIPDLHDDFLRLCPAVYLADHDLFDAYCVVVWNATELSGSQVASNASLTGATSTLVSPDVLPRSGLSSSNPAIIATRIYTESEVVSEEPAEDRSAVRLIHCNPPRKSLTRAARTFTNVT